MEFDKLFVNRMSAILGDEYEAFEESLGRDRVTSLRFNSLKRQDGFEEYRVSYGNVIDSFELSKESINWEKNGFIYKAGAPGKHAYHEAGVYYIQEPSAMSPVCFLDPQPGDKILDLCAAPGGKSTQIAARMNGEGILVANEIDKKRAQILSLNIERCAVKNAVVTSMEPGQLSEIFEGYFDKILVDAPCSGEGMFRKTEEATKNWSVDNIKLCEERQKAIIDEAVKMLAPGGRLVYSTCTFAPEEDEKSALYLIKKGLKPVKIDRFEGMVSGDIKNIQRIEPDFTDLEYEAEIKSCSARLFPHRIDGEGHFLAVFEKKGDIELNKGLYGVNGKVKGLSEKDLKVFADFVNDTFAAGSIEWENAEDKKAKDKAISLLNGRLKGIPFMFGSQLYLAPKGMPGINGLTVLRCGLHLGTIKKDRFEPSHALALFLERKEAKHTYDLESLGDDVWRYIGGQSLRIPDMENGWYLITTDGYSLGWAKYAGGTMKNHYPKGLRIYT